MLPFEIVRPRSLADVFDIATTARPPVRFLAGGTDLIVGLRHHKLAAGTVVDLKLVSELHGGIRVSDGALVVPAAATMTDLVESDEVRLHFPALIEAASVVGSLQIRNRATLAGNICNASPAADTVPTLALFGADVLIAGPGGSRRVDIRDFVRGNRMIALEPGEVVAAVHIPVPPSRNGSAFERITRRRGVDLATVNLSCRLDAEGTATFALGAVAPRPLVVDDIPLTSESDIPEKIMAVATPISDVRASAEYRRAMLAVLARRGLERARERLERSR